MAQNSKAVHPKGDFFDLKGTGSNVKTEIVAGLTTFFTMAYIIFVNPGILAAAGIPESAVLIATCISAAIGTFLMSFLANYPFALASGMGLNAFFAYTICGSMGFSWQAGLAAVFLSGIIFILITVTGLRTAIVNAIPMSLKKAISGGIGLFIAFIGFKNRRNRSFQRVYLYRSGNFQQSYRDPVCDRPDYYHSAGGMEGQGQLADRYRRNLHYRRYYAVCAGLQRWYARAGCILL